MKHAQVNIPNLFNNFTFLERTQEVSTGKFGFVRKIVISYVSTSLGTCKQVKM